MLTLGAERTTMSHMQVATNNINDQNQFPIKTTLKILSGAHWFTYSCSTVRKGKVQRPLRYHRIVHEDGDVRLC